MLLPRHENAVSAKVLGGVASGRGMAANAGTLPHSSASIDLLNKKICMLFVT